MLLSQRIKKRYYKTLRSSVEKAQSPPSLGFKRKQIRIYSCMLACPIGRHSPLNSYILQSVMHYFFLTILHFTDISPPSLVLYTVF